MKSNPWLIIIITWSNNLTEEVESETYFALPLPSLPSFPFY